MHVARRALLVAGALLCAAPAAAQLTNPIPTPISIGNIRVRVDDLVQMPSTVGSLGSKADNSPGARARINFLRESPDGRLFVNDLRGQIYSLDANYQPSLYVDVDSANGGAGSIFPDTHFSNGLAAGLISFNFHPEFTTNGKFYTIHLERAQDANTAPDFSTTDLRTGSHPVNWHTIVTEWTTPTPSAATWDSGAGARRELLRVGTTADAYFHPYGDLQFNPTASPGDPDYGMLYISGGDWGYINGAGAPQGSGTEGQPQQLQRLDTLAGTLIRIDPRSPSQTGGQAGLGDYTIPATNPFVDGNPGTLDEIYAFGFRNGHRMAWDDDGTLVVNNVGHANLEEIERILPGGNYGWALREGTFINGNDLAHGGNGDADDVFAHNVTNALDVDFRGQEYLYPMAQYDHGEGSANAGGFFYHGSAVRQLTGKYIFGDIVNGRIFVADAAAMKNVDITEPVTNVAVQQIQLYTRNGQGVETNVTLPGLVGNSRADVRFGLDSAGEIYLMTKTDGFIRKLVSDLSELILTVNRGTGAVSFGNSTGETITIDGYTIASTLGSLNPAGGSWSSLTDQGLMGWTEASPSSAHLSEMNETGALAIVNGATRSLGAPFAPQATAFGVDGEDLEFMYTMPGGQTVNGIVQYEGISSNNLTLTIDPTTGLTTLKNTSTFPVSIEGYSIFSASSSLEPSTGEWRSLADQGVGGWQEAGPTAGVVSELNPVSTLLLASGAIFNLGSLFDEADGERDLSFEFLIAGAPDARLGVVRYRLATDFNDDGEVDAADLSIWETAFGASAAGDADADGDTDGVDFLTWQRQLGMSIAEATASSGAVPEPGAATMLLLGLALAGRRSRPL
jgi:hypothetical protein